MSDDIVKVDPMDSTKRNSQVVNSLDDGGTVEFKPDQPCYWNDAEFKDSAKVCDNGVTYECQIGHWLKLKEGC